MYKQIFTIALSALAFTGVQAQYLGIKGGLTLSNLNFDQVTEKNLRVGYHLGAFVNLPINEGFAIQPEINYTTKGATAQYDMFFFQGESSFNMNYFDVPVMGVVKLGNAFDIHFGPYIGFLNRASLKSDGVFGEDHRELNRDDFNSIDYGVAAGFALNFNALQFGARYHYGLQKIANSSNADLFLGDARHSYLQVFAAMRFGAFTD